MASLTALMDPLAQVAARRLPQMFNPDVGLFSHKTLAAPSGFRNVGENVRYSAAAVVGLVAAQRCGLAAAGFSCGPVVDALLGRARSGVDLGTAGIILWALALTEDPRAAEVVPCVRALAQVPARCATADLGMALCGAAVCAAVSPALHPEVSDLAGLLSDAIVASFDPRARLFRTREMAAGLSGLAFSRSTSAASQFYALHGLFLHGCHVTGVVREEARSAAHRLVETQGPAGQWWWVYGLPGGRVVEGYPVYSVHQDAMAVFSLLPFQERPDDCFEPALVKGLEWLMGRNELRSSLVSTEDAFIARCIQRKGSDADFLWGMSRTRAARTLGACLLGLSAGGPEAPAGRLEVLNECRSYHLGWLLYAWTILKDRVRKPATRD